MVYFKTTNMPKTEVSATAMLDDGVRAQYPACQGELSPLVQSKSA